MVAVIWLSLILFILVNTLPLIGLIIISGRILFTWEYLLGLDVPYIVFLARDIKSWEFVFDINISSGAPLGRI